MRAAQYNHNDLSFLVTRVHHCEYSLVKGLSLGEMLYAFVRESVGFEEHKHNQPRAAHRRNNDRLTLHTLLPVDLSRHLQKQLFTLLYDTSTTLVKTLSSVVMSPSGSW